MRVLAAALVLFTIFAIGAPAYAIVPIEEVRAGVFAHGCCGLGSHKEDGAAINAEAVFSSPRILSVVGSPRPVFGATLAMDDGATSQIYGGLEWKVEISRFFVAAGAGITVHNGETDRYDPIADAGRVAYTVFYGCPVMFRLAGDVGYQVTDAIAVSLHWNHISNAELCSENEGLDQIGLRIGVRI